jgi:hypothetical protein
VAVLAVTFIFSPLASPGGDVAVSEREPSSERWDSSAVVKASLKPASATASRSETACVRPLRRGVVDRKLATWRWQDRLGIFRTPSARKAARATSCAYLRFIRRLWSLRADRYYRSWLSTFTLRDTDDWRTAVNTVQRVFPGTASWLLSCSGAEGGHGRWIGYGGQPYSRWLRDSDTVGGPLQFRFSTFTGMYRRALDYARERGFRVPSHIDSINTDYRGEFTAAWRSMLGQALAGGWARYTGNDASHWSASFGRGC